MRGLVYAQRKRTGLPAAAADTGGDDDDDDDGGDGYDVTAKGPRTAIATADTYRVAAGRRRQQADRDNRGNPRARTGHVTSPPEDFRFRCRAPASTYNRLVTNGTMARHYCLPLLFAAVTSLIETASEHFMVVCTVHRTVLLLLHRYICL